MGVNFLGFNSLHFFFKIIDANPRIIGKSWESSCHQYARLERSACPLAWGAWDANFDEDSRVITG